jgi:hypothetical protein
MTSDDTDEVIFRIKKFLFVLFNICCVLFPVSIMYGTFWSGRYELLSLHMWLSGIVDLDYDWIFELNLEN